MLLKTRNKVFNRREDNRERTYTKARYFGNDGVTHRSEIINLSFGGARLTTRTDVQVGDRFHLLNELESGLVIQKHVEVRWVSALPGGHRQVVGVQFISDGRRLFQAA